MKASFACFNPLCPRIKFANESGLDINRIAFKDLIERVEEYQVHYDYCCPYCQKVIICSEEQIL